MFFIDTPLKDGKVRNEQQAKAVCTELQKFCPASKNPGSRKEYESMKKNDRIYLGAALNSASSSHQVGLYFKYDPSNSAEENSILGCPSWEYEKGIKDNSCGKIISPVIIEPGKVPTRNIRNAGLGPTCS